MKSIVVFAILVCVVVPVQATCHEINNGYTPGLTIDNSDTLLMMGGG